MKFYNTSNHNANQKCKIIEINFKICNETIKTLLREIKEDLNKWWDILCSWTSKCILIEDRNSPQIGLCIQCGTNQNPSKRNWQTASKLYMGRQEKPKQVWKRAKKTYNAWFQDHSNKTVWYWLKNRYKITET